MRAKKKTETYTHQFKLSAGEEVLLCQLDCTLDWQPFDLTYRATVNGELITEGSRNEKDIERQVPQVAPHQKSA